MNICHGQCWYNQMVLVDPRDPTRNTVWIGGDLATARPRTAGDLDDRDLVAVQPVPGLPYAHADHHAAAFKMTGTPTLILGNDGGLNITTTTARRSERQEQRPGSHLYYTVAGNPKFPNLVIGGTQDNGTRLRTANCTTHNQVIGGDGMGTAYSQDNTNTVIGSAQGSLDAHEPQQQRPRYVFQNWAAATSRPERRRLRVLHGDRSRAGESRSDGARVLPLLNSRVWKTTNGGLNWARIASAIAPTSPGLPARPAIPLEPLQPRREPGRPESHRGRRRRWVPRHHDGRRRDLDGHQPRRRRARLPGLRHQRDLAGQPEPLDHLGGAGARRGPGDQGVIATPGDSWSTATFAARQNGLPDLPVTRVYFDPRDASRNTIYAATHVGLYRTTDGGSTGSPTATGCRPCASTTSTCRPTAASCASRPTAVGSGSCRSSSS